MLSCKRPYFPSDLVDFSDHPASDLALPPRKSHRSIRDDSLASEEGAFHFRLLRSSRRSLLVQIRSHHSLRLGRLLLRIVFHVRRLR